MTPVKFEQANTTYGPPPGLEESQVMRIFAFRGQAASGSCDGSPLVVTCWCPNDEERQAIAEGKPIFVTIMGELPPHFLTTRFEDSINPS